MTENLDRPEQTPEQPEPQPTREPVLKTRWRDRAWTLRAMIAVAAASFVVGGLLGGFIGAAVSHDDHPGEHRMRPWGPGHGPGGFQRGWRWQGPGQPPGVAPNTPNAPNAPNAPSAPAPSASPGATG
jgi:hypothetical protein